MIRGIHYFSTELKTKIDVIPRGCFNTVTEQIYHITIRNLGIASGPSHGRRHFLMDSHIYSYETSIFTLGAPPSSHTRLASPEVVDRGLAESV